MRRLALNNWLETEPEFKFSSVSPALPLTISFFTRSSEHYSSRGRAHFCSAIYMSYVGTARVRPKSFLLRDSALEALPFSIPQRVFVGFLREMVKMLVSIYGLLFPFMWCSGGTDRVRRGFGFKVLTLFCSSLDMMSMGQEQTAQDFYCTM